METHSFTAGADYGTYAATINRGPADTLRNVIASNGATVLKPYHCGGTSGNLTNIAGAARPTLATHYVKIGQFNGPSRLGVTPLYDFYVRVLSGSPIPEMKPNGEDAPEAPRSNGRGCRVIGPATAKNDTFAITVNARDTIGIIVGVDLERGAPAWDVIAGTGVFTGSFVITL